MLACIYDQWFLQRENLDEFSYAIFWMSLTCIYIAFDNDPHRSHSGNPTFDASKI